MSGIVLHGRGDLPVLVLLRGESFVRVQDARTRCESLEVH